MTGNVDSSRQKYVIGFTVHEAKQLSLTGSSVDPLVVVRAAGLEFKTQMKRDKVAHAKFEESYIWSDVMFTNAEFNMAFIEFELQAGCIFTRNDVIGIGKVQLSMVRKRPNHSYNLKMLQLTQATHSSAKLKVSVFCYTEGDEPPRPEEEGGEDEDVAGMMNDIGAAIIGAGGEERSGHSQAYHLFVQVHRAAELGGGKNKFNPYVQIEFNSHTLALPTFKNTHSFSSDEGFRIPVVTPLFADSILIRVWDKKSWGDDIIMQGRLSFSLLRMHAMQPKWFNFYGFDKEEVADVQAITGMGEAAEANAYMGRLLISGRVQKVAHESELMRPGLVKGNIVDEPPTSTVSFAIDVFEISNCPGVQAYVKVSLGSQQRKTHEIGRNDDDEDPQKPGRFTFTHGKGRVDSWTMVIPSEKANQLDLLVSIYADAGTLLGGKAGTFHRIGFKRVKMSEIRDWDGHSGVPVWVAMRPMAHLSTSVEAGSVLIGLFKSAGQIKERPKMEVKPLNFTLRAYCIMARHLNAMKEDHMPNPIVSVSCCGKTASTLTLRSTTAPQWHETLEIPVTFQCTLNNMKVHPEPVQVIVYDEENESSLQTAVNGLKGRMVASVGLGDDTDKPAKGKKKAADAQSQGTKHTKGGTAIGMGDILKEVGGGLFSDLKDAVGEMRGDVLATKRRHELVDGKRVIGRTQVRLRKLLRPTDEKAKLDLPRRLKWVKLLGGRMGNHAVGDILIGFELLKTKYAKDIPKRSLNPQTKDCTLSVALLGLRQVMLEDPNDTKFKPKVLILGPSSDEGVPQSNSFQEVQWTKKVEGKVRSLSVENDSNKRWCFSGIAGYEFLNVVHLTVQIPKLPIYEPAIIFRLYNEEADTIEGDAIAEGRFSIADIMTQPDTWVVYGERKSSWKEMDKRFRMDSSSKAKNSVKALDEYKESDDEDGEHGIAVSDAEDEEVLLKDYVEVTITDGPLRVGFNKTDSASFPPVVTELADDSAAKKEGVKKGDWLVGYRGPEDPNFKLTGVWKPSHAMEWVEQMNASKVRPLTLKFRRKNRLEVTSYFTEEATAANKGAGLEIRKERDVKPPQIVDDISDRKTWKKQGVETGWFVVDINGVDLMDMSGADPKFQKLLKMRPACITCRPFGKAGQGEEQLKQALADDKEHQRKKEVMLDGMPSRMLAEIEHMVRHTDGELRNRGVPLPKTQIPPVTDARHLNQRVNRSCLMDVRGVVRRLMVKSKDDGDDEADRARPSVSCTLEQSLDAPLFHTVQLKQGNKVKALLKMAFKLVHPVATDWVRKIKSKDDPDVMLFEESFFRENYKHKQPQMLRVRSYIIRGLNVSGSGSAGYGNPYLYYNTGSSFTQLEGHRKMGEVEPHFFRTEECDVMLPEESVFELGLMDYTGNGVDQMIGRTIIDLEDRWYSKMFREYMQMNKVPVEYRPMINPRSNLSKGSLEMWMEVLDTQDAAEVPVNALYQPPPTEVEIRVILWGLKDVSRKMCVDDVGEEREKIDVMVRCQIESRAYSGPQPKEQESDIHRSCVNEAEFNWRYVYSRVQVTKGAPLDCVLELSLWETFAISRPVCLCETRIDMKHYCKRVALQRTMIQIEDEIPLTSNAHSALCENEEDGADNIAQKDEGDEDSDEEREQEEDTQAMVNVVKAKPPAAMMKIIIQVIAQNEASLTDMKAGLGRNDPNQFPALTFPKTGRSWQATLPNAATAIEAVIDTVQGGKKRARIMMIILAVAMPVFLVHYIKKADGCPLIMKSCKSQSTCASCSFCYHLDKADATFCMYTWADSKTCPTAKADFCNLKSGQCECMAASCTVAKDCIREPNKAGTSISVSGGGVMR